MASNQNRRNVSRILKKLDEAVKAKNYYEAHQIYRTLYFRYVAQELYSEALDLLYEGANLLLQNQQLESGADLAILFIEVLKTSKYTPTMELFEKISKLFAAIGPSIPERETFLTNAVRWSSKENPRGHRKLHQKIADVYWKEENYVLGRHHFLLSSDGYNCALLLIEFHRAKGYTSETDLFITQAVLQYLCLNNYKAAQQVFNVYTENHPCIKRKLPPFDTPLFNFLWYLLIAIANKNQTAYKTLIDKYEPSLNRDPCYLKYLETIGQLYLSIQPSTPTIQVNRGSSQGPSDLFGTILESIINSLDEQQQPPPQQQQSTATNTPPPPPPNRQPTEPIFEQMFTQPNIQRMFGNFMQPGVLGGLLNNLGATMPQNLNNQSVPLSNDQAVSAAFSMLNNIMRPPQQQQQPPPSRDGRNQGNN